MKELIGIAGAKFSGKSTSAALFCSEYGFSEISFAFPLKRATGLSFGIDMESFEKPELKEKPFSSPRSISLGDLLKFRTNLEQYGTITDHEVCSMYKVSKGIEIKHPRHLLQYLGTDLIRNFVHTDFWVTAIMTDIENKDKVVISDARFPNERSLVDDLGGRLLLIKRPGYEAGGHASETTLGEEDEYNVVINNEGTVKDLYRGLADWYENDKKQRQNGTGASTRTNSRATQRDQEPKEAPRAIREEEREPRS